LAKIDPGSLREPDQHDGADALASAAGWKRLAQIGKTTGTSRANSAELDEL